MLILFEATIPTAAKCNASRQQKKTAVCLFITVLIHVYISVWYENVVVTHDMIAIVLFQNILFFRFFSSFFVEVIKLLIPLYFLTLFFILFPSLYFISLLYYFDAFFSGKKKNILSLSLSHHFTNQKNENYKAEEQAKQKGMNEQKLYIPSWIRRKKIS